MSSRGNEYSIIKYDMQTGLLIQSEGVLFEKFKIPLSKTIADLKIDIHAWPFAKTDSFIFTRDLFEFLDNSTVDSKSQFTTQFSLIIDDSKYWINIFTIVLQENGTVTKSLIFTLVDDYKNSVDLYVNSTDRDSLTGVLTRDALHKCVDKMLDERRERIALLFDIDSFKTLNDTYGHANGDRMLADIIKHIISELEVGDQIGRIGGDEFFILLNEFKERESAEYFARNLCTSVKRSLPDGTIVSMSVGIVMSPEDGFIFEVLYDNANKALSYVKGRGGDSICFYDEIKNFVDYYEISDSRFENLTIPTSDVSHMIRYCYKTTSDGRHNKGDYFLSESFEKTFNLLPDAILHNRIIESGILSELDWEDAVTKIRHLIASDADTVLYLQYKLKTKNGSSKWYNFCIAKETETNSLYISLTDVHDFVVNYNKLKNLVDFDELTNLHTRRNFVAKVSEIVKNNPDEIRRGEYALIYFDISKFKMINDIFGLEKGDQLLVYLAECIKKTAHKEFHSCRMASDRFVIFMKADYDEVIRFTDDYIKRIDEYPLAFKVVCNFGVYITDGSINSIELMIDRAAIAQSAIKGSVLEKVNFFSNGLRSSLVNEHAIINEMTTALRENQFKVFYQPQYNHSTGDLVGAEALVRWFHPRKGVVSPGEFIHIFEKNGFITFLDLYVLEEVCRLLRELIDSGITPVPVSINLSKCDIFRTDLIDQLENIRSKYSIDTELVRLEITESTMSEESHYAKTVIDELRRLGYMIEMDDFGTGYSSLNVLKNIKMDVIKLDMEFIADSSKSNRAGKILRSIIRMATWLNMPVIAEGVETEGEANYLKSIGCNIIQGYYYSRPIPTEQFVELIKNSKITQIEHSSEISSESFWSPNSLEDAMFNRFVGPAAILEYEDGDIEILRMNEKLINEIGNDIDERTIMRTRIDCYMDEDNFNRYIEACKKAVDTNHEVVVETWRKYNKDENAPKICLRSTIKVVEVVDHSYILYSLVENVTEGHKTSERLKKDDAMIDYLCESLDIYLWEYDIDNDVVYPSERCRDVFCVPDVIVNFAKNDLDTPIFGGKNAEILSDIHNNLRNGDQYAVKLVNLDGVPDEYIVKYEIDTNPDRIGRFAYGTAIKYDKALFQGLSIE